MLQELTTQTGAGAWAVASLLIFLTAWIVITVRVLRTRPEQFESWAHLAFEDEGSQPSTRSKPGPQS